MEYLSDEANDLLMQINFHDKARLFPGWWKKKDCTNNQNAIFVFGDNDRQKGCGGQAIIRYCWNTHGIPTKKYPSNSNKAYYTDLEFDDNVRKIVSAIEDLILKVDYDDFEVIFFPEDGLGTGLSKLDKKAPRTLEFLNQIIDEIFGIDYFEKNRKINRKINPKDSESSNSSE